MIPAAFDYVRADSTDAAVALLAEHGDEAKLLAGGMSLLPLMKLRLAVPSVLVDVGRLRDLPYVRDAGDHLAIGALTRHRDLETSDAAARRVRRAARGRGRGRRQPGAPPRHDRRLGRARRPGVATCPAALLALDATFVARGPGRRAGDRGGPSSSPASSRPRSRPTSCSPRSGCRRPGPNGFSYQKFNRRAQDWAIVGALAVRVDGDDPGRRSSTWAPTPLRARGRRGRARGRRVDRRRGGARGRGHRAVRRSQRRRRVPRAPRPGAHPARARGRRRLTGDRGRHPRGGSRVARGSASDVPKPLLELARPPARRVGARRRDAIRVCGRRCSSSATGRGAVERRRAARASTVVRARGWRQGIARSLRARARRARGLGAGRRGVHRARGPAARRRRRRTAGSPPRTMTARRWRSRPTAACGRTRCSLARSLWPAGASRSTATRGPGC